MGKVKPITPEEAGIQKMAELPDFVVQAFNDIIIKNMNGKRSTFKHKEVADHMRELATTSGMNVQEFHDRVEKEHWYAVEPLYEGLGWKVVYESPDRDSSFDPYFTFTKK